MNTSRTLAQLIRLSVEGLSAVLVIAVVLSSALDQERRTNERLTSEVAGQGRDLTSRQGQVSSLQAEVTDLKELWYGSPAIWQPPAIANTEIEFFDVSGTTQQELLTSIKDADICTKYGGECAPDPAVPNGFALGLEYFHPAVSGYRCYTPSTTTIPFTEFVVLPRWSPSQHGSVRIPLVEEWNALTQVIYTHEAGHVAIDQQDLAALNDQAHQLPSCGALFAFWDNPSIYDQLEADQAAYHARLHADCRPQIGCLPPGWMGW
jgi:predicted secreted Zn-dependent protease